MKPTPTAEQAKATPRPWSLCEWPNGFKREVVADDGIVCTVVGTSATKAETEANAALIVEAVNSYDQLKAQNLTLREACEIALTRNGVDGDLELVRVIKAALAQP